MKIKKEKEKGMEMQSKSKQRSKELSAFLKSVKMLSQQDKINLRNSVGKSFEKASREKGMVSFLMKTEFPDIYLSEENMPILYYVAGLQAKQSLDKDNYDSEKSVLAQNALHYLYQTSSDSTKAGIEKFIQKSKTMGTGKSLTTLNNFLSRTPFYDKLNLLYLLSDLISWNYSDDVRIKWALAIAEGNNADES